MIGTLKNSHGSQFQALIEKISPSVKEKIGKIGQENGGGDSRKKDLKEKLTKGHLESDFTQKIVTQYKSTSNEREPRDAGQPQVIGRSGTFNSSSPLRSEIGEGEKAKLPMESKMYGIFPAKFIENMNNQDDWKVSLVSSVIIK